MFENISTSLSYKLLRLIQKGCDATAPKEGNMSGSCVSLPHRMSSISTAEISKLCIISITSDSWYKKRMYLPLQADFNLTSFKRQSFSLSLASLCDRQRHTRHADLLYIFLLYIISNIMNTL